LVSIWTTLDAIEINHMVRDPLQTGVLLDPLDPMGLEAAKIKQNYSVFLQDLYPNQPSAMHCKLAHIFLRKWGELRNIIAESAPEFRKLNTTVGGELLVSYYGDGDRYGTHVDMSGVTVTLTLAKENANFTGGDHILEEHTGPVTLPFVNNKFLITPGFIEHGVTPVSCSVEDEKKGLARWSVMLFV
jgi:hypothetical protein